MLFRRIKSHIEKKRLRELSFIPSVLNSPQLRHWLMSALEEQQT